MLRLGPGILALLLLACGGGGGSSGTSSDDPGPRPDTQTSPAEAVFLLTNIERDREGLPPLEWDDEAAAVALGHSQDMSDRSFFDHVNPDGMGPGDRIAAAGLSVRGWAENIAMGYPTPEAVTAGWMNSPGHRANILLTWTTHMGIGVAYGPGGPYWTQVFLAR